MKHPGDTPCKSGEHLFSQNDDTKYYAHIRCNIKTKMYKVEYEMLMKRCVK